MLKYYFEKAYDENGSETDNSSLFEGVRIMEAGELYTKHMGQYPVISLSLKSAKQPDFELAFTMLKRQIADEFRRHRGIADRLEESDRKRFLMIMQESGENAQYLDSLAFLSRILREIYI